jgi:hypothetical protein
MINACWKKQIVETGNKNWNMFKDGLGFTESIPVAETHQIHSD